MIRIFLTDVAFAAIGGDPDDRHTGAGRYGRAPSGYAAVWLPEAVVDALTAARGPSETYSDAVLRMSRNH